MVLKSNLELQGFSWWPVTEGWEEISISRSFGIDPCCESWALTLLFSLEEKVGGVQAGAQALAPL